MLTLFFDVVLSIIYFTLISLSFCYISSEYKHPKFSWHIYFNQYKESIGLVHLTTVIGKILTRYITSLNFSPLEFGLNYLIITTMLYVILYDALTYWMHRLLHLPWLYQNFHATHHRYFPVTSGSTAASGIVDGLIIGQIPIWGPALILHCFNLGISLITLYTTIFIIGIYNLYLHSMNSYSSTILIMSNVDHLTHHKLVRCNYSNLFRFWDLICNTYKVRPNTT